MTCRLGFFLLALVVEADGRPDPVPACAEIRVVDAATGRGVPLVELETVNSLKFVTDSAGRVAFLEPGLLGREVYFSVQGHGYEVKKDGFGFAGARVTPQPGRVAEIRVTRRHAAERLCRLTGEGIYRDTVLLGHAPPLAASAHPGCVAGQDSVQAAVYHGRVYWFWGDTNRMEYPLGLYRTAGATTPTFDPADPRSNPANGIAYHYFVGPGGFARNMMPLPERSEGVIWIDGVCVVADEKGTERLVAHYSRRKGLAHELEQGIALFNDEKAIFEPAWVLTATETWRRPAGHAVAHKEGGRKWLLFGNPTPNVRVPATLRDALHPGSYEAFTAAAKDTAGPARTADGRPHWRWQKELPPTESKDEAAWIKTNKLAPEQARFHPANAADPAERVVLHSGSVAWNAHCRRWVLFAGQFGGKSSPLGEVWYAEADAPTGPFPLAVKVATHDRQSFYNVCHHPFLDRDGGRIVHFEGTYTNEFSGNPIRTPRYNYNQILYRLDLDTEALRPLRRGQRGTEGGQP